MILKKGRIVAEGLRDEVLTEPNLKQAYELDIRLIKTDKNRYWTVID
jgi:iron complex transport system ATP-binding protein